MKLTAKSIADFQNGVHYDSPPLPVSYFRFANTPEPWQTLMLFGAVAATIVFAVPAARLGGLFGVWCDPLPEGEPPLFSEDVEYVTVRDSDGRERCVRRKRNARHDR